MIAYNSLERIVFMFIINIGDALFAIAVGMISQLQIHVSSSSEFKRYLMKRKQIESFLINIKADESECKRVNEFFQFDYFVNTKKRLIEGSDLVGYLPPSQIENIVFYDAKDTLEPMFKQYKSENLIRRLSLAMRSKIYIPKDYIYEKGSKNDSLYFLIEGKAQVLGEDKQTILSVIRKGRYFGYGDSDHYVQAIGFCIISTIKKEEIKKILQEFPSISEELIGQKQQKVDGKQETNDEEVFEKYQSKYASQNDLLEKTDTNLLQQNIQDFVYDASESSSEVRSVSSDSDEIESNNDVMYHNGFYGDGNNQTRTIEEGKQEDEVPYSVFFKNDAGINHPIEDYVGGGVPYERSLKNESVQSIVQNEGALLSVRSNELFISQVVKRRQSSVMQQRDVNVNQKFKKRRLLNLSQLKASPLDGGQASDGDSDDVIQSVMHGREELQKKRSFMINAELIKSMTSVQNYQNNDQQIVSQNTLTTSVRREPLRQRRLSRIIIKEL